jgi:hypothetical protein
MGKEERGEKQKWRNKVRKERWRMLRKKLL